MAKKKTSKNNKKIKRNTVPENSLPQNIVSMGERVEENKNVYISQQVYKEIHKFTKNKTTNESGGMLVGSVIEEFSKTNIIISGFVEAKFCEATPTTLTFTHETWDYCHKEIDKKYPGKKIVGWIHTHPNFGIFLSEYDKFIQQNFFSDANQIAYVIDPIQNIEGFYFWINNNIERCKGFYVYDKTGVKITVGDDKEEDSKTEDKEKVFSGKNIAIGILSILVAFLLFSNLSIKKDMANLTNEVNQTLSNMQYQMNALYARLYSTQNNNNNSQTENTTDRQDTTTAKQETTTVKQETTTRTESIATTAKGDNNNE